MRAYKSQTGLSLIEVMISILIFSIGILGLVGLQARAVQFSSDSEDRNRAALLADELVGYMLQYNTTDITSAPLSVAYKNWLGKVNNIDYGWASGATVAVTCQVGGTPPCATGPVMIAIKWSSPSHNGTYATEMQIPS